MGAVAEVGRARAVRRAGGVWQVLVLLALAAAGVVAGLLVVLALDSRGTPSPPAAAPSGVGPSAVGPSAVDTASPGTGSGGLDSSARAVRRAARVLGDWDRDRAAAYARGDPSALRRLYVPGSGAAARDLRVLGAYAERGLVVRDLATQVLALEVLSVQQHRMRLEVTDRRVGGRAVSRSGRRVAVALPRDAPSTHVLVLRRHDRRWQVVSVSAV